MTDDCDATCYMAREKAAELLTENGVWLMHEQALSRVAAEVQRLMVRNIDLALDVIGNQEAGAVRARRWKELAKKMRRVARMLGRRCDIAEQRARVAERKVELVRRWARMHVMTQEQRSLLRVALDGDDVSEKRAR